MDDKKKLPESSPKSARTAGEKGSPPVNSVHTGDHRPILNQLPTCLLRQKNPRELEALPTAQLALRFIPIRPSCPWPPYWVCHRAPLTRRRECRRAKHRNRPSHIGRSLPSPRRL